MYIQRLTHIIGEMCFTVFSSDIPSSQSWSDAGAFPNTQNLSRFIDPNLQFSNACSCPGLSIQTVTPKKKKKPNDQVTHWLLLIVGP